jgi:hypothetical protein
MKAKLTALYFIVALVLIGCVKDREFPADIYQQPAAPTLGTRTPFHYWNFNGAVLLTPTFTIGGGSLSYTGGGAADAVSPGTLLNARNADVAGNALRLRNPAGVFIINAPSVNYKDIILSFAVQRTNNGPQLNTISYTIDGTNYITDSLKPNMLQIDIAWQQYYFDFSAIKRVNNNPNFKIKITFNVNATGIDGNDRYDNICLDGNIINPLPPPAPEILHYWNFNNNSNFTNLITPTQTKGGASLAYTAVWDEVTPGTTINARNGDAAGSALRLRNPAGVFTITAPTTGYKNIRLTFAVMRTSSGAQQNIITYTLDGTNYISTGITTNTYNPLLEPDFGLITYDFSNISGINNNPNFKIRIEFAIGNTNTSGNNRFDNLVVEGTII